MGIFQLFMTAAFPVLEVLIVTGVGLFIATDYIGILGEAARGHLNDVVYYVFNPALLSSNLTKALTPESVAASWFISVNILLTFIIGSAFGLMINLFTKPPSHTKGLIVSCCAAGNVGNMLLVILPSTCKEKWSPFGAPDVCNTNGIAFASLSLAVNQILTWSYVYNILKTKSLNTSKISNDDERTTAVKSTEETEKTNSKSCTCGEDSASISVDCENCETLYTTNSAFNDRKKVTMSEKVTELKISVIIAFKYLLTPSTIGVLVGLIIGVSYPIKKLLVGKDPPLRVIQNSATLLGSGAIPTMTLVMGGNFIKAVVCPVRGHVNTQVLCGFRKASIKSSVIIGVLVVRYALLPFVGVGIVKGAVHFGLIVTDDPLYQFTLMLHYALPPSVYIGTITQYFGSSESETAFIFLWSFVAALFFLPIWLTYFIYLVSN